MLLSSAQVRSEAPWHRFGMGLSALCLVHCLGLPWLLASLPVVARAALPEALRDTEWLHAALIVPVLLISGPVLLRRRPGLVLTIVVLMAFAALIAGLWVENEVTERALTVSGAALIMVAHAARLRARHPH